MIASDAPSWITAIASALAAVAAAASVLVTVRGNRRLDDHLGSQDEALGQVAGVSNGNQS